MNPASGNSSSRGSKRKLFGDDEVSSLAQAILSSAGVGIYIVQNGKFVYVSPLYQKLTGYSERELIATHSLSYIHPEDRTMVREKAIRSLQTKSLEPYEYRFIKKHQEILWALETITPISYEGQRATLGSFMDISHRKKMEEALQKSEENYRLLFESAGQGILIAKDEKIQFANTALAEIVGYPKEVITARPFISFIHPDDRSMVLNRHKMRLKGDDPENDYQFRAVTSDGTVKWLQINARKISWDGVPASLSFITDITDRRQAQEDLRASEEKYRTIIEQMEDGYFEIDLAGNYTFVNNAESEIVGYSREEMIGMNARQYLDGESLKRAAQVYKASYKTGEPFKSLEVEIIRKDGTKGFNETSGSVIRDAGGKPVGFRGFTRDVTERKQAEMRLQRSEERYRDIFENAQEGIYQTTCEGKFLMANQAMARILGYDSPEELLGEQPDISLRIYVNPEERTKVIEQVQREGVVKGQEIQFYRKDGRKIWISRTMRIVRDEQNNEIYLEGIVEDITEKKESVDRLRKALGGTVQAIASVVETKDPYTAGHQRRAADLARAMGTELSLSPDQIEGLRMAGIIHDIGKISVPAEILSTPRRLTAIEFSLIKMHAQSGYDILKDVDFPWPIARMVLEHHERMSGSGYPHGLSGNEILMESRILAVADVVEAMATHRPYRPALGLDAALEEISSKNGILYDPNVVSVCLRLFREKNYIIKT
ncbi:MAG TPA: PAS domain S-box protein [Smithellaceae bacterium]|nr:PAS domain S-box protein [Smithellaceae bacterium]